MLLLIEKIRQRKITRLLKHKLLLLDLITDVLLTQRERERDGLEEELPLLPPSCWISSVRNFGIVVIRLAVGGEHLKLTSYKGHRISHWLQD